MWNIKLVFFNSLLGISFICLASLLYVIHLQNYTIDSTLIKYYRDRTREIEQEDLYIIPSKRLSVASIKNLKNVVGDKISISEVKKINRSIRILLPNYNENFFQRDFTLDSVRDASIYEQYKYKFRLTSYFVLGNQDGWCYRLFVMKKRHQGCQDVFLGVNVPGPYLCVTPTDSILFESTVTIANKDLPYTKIKAMEEYKLVDCEAVDLVGWK